MTLQKPESHLTTSQVLISLAIFGFLGGCFGGGLGLLAFHSAPSDQCIRVALGCGLVGVACMMIAGLYAVASYATAIWRK